MRYIFLFCFTLILSSCSNKLHRFKPATICCFVYDNQLTGSNKPAFDIFNRWVRSSYDTLISVRKTIRIDTDHNSLSDLTNFTLHHKMDTFTLQSESGKKKSYKYTVKLIPLHRAHFADTSFLVLGTGGGLDNIMSRVHKESKRSILYFYGNTINGIQPWQSYHKEKYYFNEGYFQTIVFNKISFSKGWGRDEKLYMKRVINNQLIEKVGDSNVRERRFGNSSKFTLTFNYYNNNRRIFKKKADYAIDFNISLSPDKDSLYIEPQYYSETGKEINTLIPDILDSKVVLSKEDFDAGNHFELNLALEGIIARYFGNIRFIQSLLTL